MHVSTVNLTRHLQTSRNTHEEEDEISDELEDLDEDNNEDDGSDISEEEEDAEDYCKGWYFCPGNSPSGAAKISND